MHKSTRYGFECIVDIDLSLRHFVHIEGFLCKFRPNLGPTFDPNTELKWRKLLPDLGLDFVIEHLG